jgi:hypothetical protein
MSVSNFKNIEIGKNMVKAIGLSIEIDHRRFQVSGFSKTS